MKIITNNIPRDLIDGAELTATERADFDYVDWDGIDQGVESATFFRYRGELHDLGEFTRDYGITRGAGLPDHLSKWDGYRSDSAFSALVVRLVKDEWEWDERIIVGRVLT